MIRAVVDANVFVSATINPTGTPGKVLDAYRARLFELVISEPIFAEIDRVLSYAKVRDRYGIGDDEIESLRTDLNRLGTVVTPTMTLNVVADRSDNRYLECAVEGRAAYVVSGDADLLDLGQYQEIRIMTPANFLEVLRRTSAER